MSPSPFRTVEGPFPRAGSAMIPGDEPGLMEATLSAQDVDAIEIAADPAPMVTRGRACQEGLSRTPGIHR